MIFLLDPLNPSGFTQTFLNPNQIFFSNAPQIVWRRIIEKSKQRFEEFEFEYFGGSNVANNLGI